MALLQSINLEHLPADYTIHVALFREIKNAAFLHQQLLAGNTGFEYALIDASIIVSKLHVLAAAYRAVNDLLENRLKSRNVHSEIVFSLSPNNNIAESFRRFGITPNTTSLLVLKLSTPARPIISSTMQSHLISHFEGDQIPFTDENLSLMTDTARVKKIYKLNSVGGGGKAVGGKEIGDAERKELEILILGSMALRGATN